MTTGSSVRFSARSWLQVSITAIVIGGVGYGYYAIQRANQQVAQDLRTHPHSERALRTMLLTLADGRDLPVNYLREENIVYIGVDGRWWREFVGAGQPVQMLIQDQPLSGHATVVLDDPDFTDEVFARLRPTAPSWLPAWLNGKLVVIKLSQS